MKYNPIKKLLNQIKCGVASHYIENIDDEPVLDIKFQDGGTADHERNGVFIEDLLSVAYARLKHYNDTIPCRENSIALTKIDEAIMWLYRRKLEREHRGVYGTEKK